MDHQSPFFILANPRSGSSLLRIICDCNKALAVPPESGFLLWWKPKYELADASKWQQDEFLKQVAADVVSSKKFETWNIEKNDLFQFFKEHQPKNFSEAGSLVYHLHAIKRGKNPLVWGDKNNYYIRHLEDILDLYSNARFIHLVRDGRDVACSYKNLKSLSSTSDYFPDLPVNIEAIAEEWAQNNNNIYEFLASVAESNFLVINYEDVIMSLEESCRKICSFLNVPFDEKMLNYDSLNRKNNLEPAETLDWKMNTLKKPDKSRIGQYRDQLTPSEIQAFNKRASAILEKYGYV